MPLGSSWCNLSPSHTPSTRAPSLSRVPKTCLSSSLPKQLNGEPGSLWSIPSLLQWIGFPSCNIILSAPLLFLWAPLSPDPISLNARFVFCSQYSWTPLLRTLSWGVNFFITTGILSWLSQITWNANAERKSATTKKPVKSLRMTAKQLSMGTGTGLGLRGSNWVTCLNWDFLLVVIPDAL